MQLMMTAGAKLISGGFAKALMTAGTVAGAIAPIAAGQAAKATAEYEAKQLEKKSKAEMATATARASEEDRRKRLVASRAQAVGASSGGGRDLTLEGAIEEEGTYRQLVALWEGEEVAEGLKSQANATRMGGKARARAGMFEGLAKGATGYASLKDKYG